jgi:hypothetical protein
MKLSSAVLCALAIGATACSDGAATSDVVPASFALSQASSSSVLDAALLSSNDSLHFGGARIMRSNIDSLIVEVTRVEVLPDSEIHRCHPPVGDSVSGFRPGMFGGPGEGGPMGPRGGCGRGGHPGFGEHPPRPDSLGLPDSVRAEHAQSWYSLDISGSNRLDLMALPTDSSSGLVLATGTLPTGEYGAARLVISSATIWFDTTITTTSGFTFLPNTPYDVTLPNRNGVSSIMTNAGFTIADGASTVVLTFDANAAIRGAAVTDSGTIILKPVLRPHH